MVVEIVFALVGALLGTLTSYWFERRATKAAEAENAELQAELHELQEELRVLRSTLYSLGGGTATQRREQRELDGNLVALVADRARLTQDAQGRVDARRLTAHFVAQGRDPAQIEAAITDLVAEGAAELEGTWLTMR